MNLHALYFFRWCPVDFWHWSSDLCLLRRKTLQQSEGRRIYKSLRLRGVDFMSSLHEDMVVDPDQRRRYWSSHRQLVAPQLVRRNHKLSLLTLGPFLEWLCCFHINSKTSHGNRSKSLASRRSCKHFSKDVPSAARTSPRIWSLLQVSFCVQPTQVPFHRFRMFLLCIVVMPISLPALSFGSQASTLPAADVIDLMASMDKRPVRSGLGRFPSCKHCKARLSTNRVAPEPPKNHGGNWTNKEVESQ